MRRRNLLAILFGLLGGIIGADVIAYAATGARLGPITGAFSGDLFGADISDSIDGVVTINADMELNGVVYPDTAQVAPAWSEGVYFWDSENKTWSMHTAVSDTTLQIGQEGYVRATNKTGVQIDDGSPVYVNGAQGNRATVALAKADVHATAQMIAVATHDCADNATCYFTLWGEIRGLDTTGTPYGEVWADGQHIYLSDTTAGDFTKTEPGAPSFSVTVGTVERAHATEGIILVAIHIDHPSRVTSYATLYHDWGTGSPQTITVSDSVTCYQVPLATAGQAVGLTADTVGNEVDVPATGYFAGDYSISGGLSFQKVAGTSAVLHMHLTINGTNAPCAPAYRTATSTGWGWASIPACNVALTNSDTVEICVQNLTNTDNVEVASGSVSVRYSGP